MNSLNVFFILFSLIFNLYFSDSQEKINFKRAELIDNLSREAVGAHCFCRLGNERGYEVKEYSNSYHDFGSLKYWKRFGSTRKRRNHCESVCKQKAIIWLATKSNDFLCNLANKTSTYHLVAYSKVGGSKWRRTHTKRDIPCTNESADYVDPCSLPSPDRYTDFSFQIMRNGGQKFRAHVTPKCKVPEGWGYHWRVSRVNFQTKVVIPGTELSMPNHWWTHNHSCSFNGYQGNSISGDEDTAGVFNINGLYKVTFGVYGGPSNQEWVERIKYFNVHGEYTY